MSPKTADYRLLRTMIFIQIVLTSFVVVAYENHLISDLQQTIIFTSSCLLSAVVFSILPTVTKKLHNYHKQKNSSVSVRYQSVENIRVARLLNILMILYASFYISETALYYIYYFFVADYLLNKIFMATYIMSIVIEVFASVMVMTCSHPKLRSASPFLQRKPTKVSTSCNNEVISSDGRVLSFRADEEQKIYFESYTTMWNF